MRRTVLLSGILLALLALIVTGAGVGAQSPALSLELSGINAIDLPRVDVTVNVYDALGQPLDGLTIDHFHLSGPLADVATITRVENVTNNALPFGTVLVIDASESMAGAPIEQAKAAARTYIETMRDIDPVALVAFGSTVQVLQDFTTDRAALLAAIDSIDLLGRTALYEAADSGINLASSSPDSRHAMVLLSDGVEYGGLSDVTPEDVIQNAFLNGVPSYTIGLGYGADRSFLEALATETLAQFYESPTPAELQAIYRALADRLSSQYILTLDVNAPLDGTEYPFGLTVETADASASQFGTVRAPIPVPVVDLSGLPTEPISTVTDLALTIKADQDVARVAESINGEPVAEQTEPPYTLRIDPVEFPPGPITLDVTATDVDGDTGTGSATLEIAALPPQVSLSRDVSELGEINEPLEITVNGSGQTPITEVRVSLNGGEFVTLVPPYTFVLDPLELPPGDNHLEVVVVNESGLEATYPADFIIAEVPPDVAVEGVSDGQSVNAPVSFSINTHGQTPVSEIVVTLNGEVVEPVDGVYTIDPQTVAPGAADLTVSATTDNGQTGSASVTLMVAPLPPVVSVEGIEDGQTVAGDVNITIDAVSQTPVVHGMVTVNGVDIAHPVTVPATITVPLSAMQPGENTVEVMVDTQAGQSSSVTLVIIAPANLFTPTPDALATGTASALAAATRTAVAIAAAGEAATQSAGTQVAATESAVTSATQSAATAQAQSEATQISATEAAQTQNTQIAATSAVQATVTAQAQESVTQAAQATATAEVQATATQQAVANAAAQATVTAEAQAVATQAEATAVAQAATATPAPASTTPIPATVTQAPATIASTPTLSNSRATADAATVLVQQAATNAGATVVAHRTLAADARASTQAAATQAVEATASAAAQSANATATSEARATAQVQTNQTATALAASISTATAQAGRTATHQAEATDAAHAAATATARTVDEATSVAETRSAEAAAAASVAESATAGAERAAATAGAQATRTARALLVAGTATAAATSEVTAEAQAAAPSHTPQPTLTPVEVQPEQGGGVTTGLWAIFIVIIILAVVLVVVITRVYKRRNDMNKP
ncbi:MAG: VWA domain-containing protein [Anaerolineae bacterium]